MNVVDSSGWLEFFADGPNADFFAPPILETETLIVPSISLYEVFKVVMAQKGEASGLQAVALMQQGLVVDLDSHLALTAAYLSTKLKLPMADSIILATARGRQATLWTQDVDFSGIEGVRYVEKK